MKRIIAALSCALVPFGVHAGVLDIDEIIARGDANHSGTVDVSDAAFLSSYLFQGGQAPPCLNEADANHDGAVNGTDVSYITNFLFLGGPAPPAPGPYNTTCTNSSSPTISCNAASC